MGRPIEALFTSRLVDAPQALEIAPVSRKHGTALRAPLRFFHFLKSDRPSAVFVIGDEARCHDQPAQSEAERLSATRRRAERAAANGAIEMLLFHQEVFDEVITGTSNTWYSSAEFNGLIGAADDLILFAVATDVSGTATLKVYVDTSGDNEHWYQPGTGKIDASLATPTDVKSASVRLLGEALASFARLRINLTGTTPACRLKLTVTGRSG